MKYINKYLEYFDSNLNFDFNINNYKNNTIKEKSKKFSNININQQVETVDILIPIFNQTELTLNCIHSVINSLPFNKTNCQIYLLDDASNDISLVNYSKYAIFFNISLFFYFWISS